MSDKSFYLHPYQTKGIKMNDYTQFDSRYAEGVDARSYALHVRAKELLGTTRYSETEYVRALELASEEADKEEPAELTELEESLLISEITDTITRHSLGADNASEDDYLAEYQSVAAEIARYRKKA
jgi:hypothetical protein